MSSLTLLFFFFFAAAAAILLASSAPTASAALCNKDDKKALLAIKSAFNSFPTWINAFACCDWYGVACDDHGRVQTLWLQQSDFSGTIPPAIGDLPFLIDLRLHHLPNLVGGIPPAIAKLKNLRSLTISWTNISGHVPSFLSQLPALWFLDLSFNNLSGQIPDSLGGMPSLRGIDISRNKLTGKLPPSLFQHATEEPSLSLSHNQLSGEVPATYGGVKFNVIDLSRNQITGDPSVLFGRRKAAVQIDLSRNLLEFDLSKVEFPAAAVVVDLNHNKIYGRIPVEIGELRQISFFNVSYNKLCGEIPSGGGKLDQFDESCYFHNKCLCGPPLPPCKF